MFFEYISCFVTVLRQSTGARSSFHVGLLRVCIVSSHEDQNGPEKPHVSECYRYLLSLCAYVYILYIVLYSFTGKGLARHFGDLKV